MLRPRPSDLRLIAEFVGLFVLIPVGVALFLPAAAMLGVLLVVTAVGAVLLHRTNGFSWGDLTIGWRQIEWRILVWFSAVTLSVSLALVALVLPEGLLMLYRFSPVAWLAVMVLYPLLSAFPQEVLFRPLFFRRYASILPPGRGALVLNAGIFSLAHLLYWNWIVMVMTFAGGLVFAWAYEEKKSFPLAVVLYAVAGNILFTVGLGMLFFTGTVERPF